MSAKSSPFSPRVCQRAVFPVLLVAVLALSPIPARGQRTNANITPAQKSTVLYQPCTYWLGSDSGPLRELAAYQRYTYAEFKDAAATLDVLATLGNYGIIQIGGTHGIAGVGIDSPNDALWAECFSLWTHPTLVAAEAARDARLAAICGGHVFPGGATLTCPNDAVAGKEDKWGTTAYAIVLKRSGINKLLKPAEHSIVFSGICFSIRLASALPLSAMIDYMGYTDTTTGVKVASDTNLLYRRIWGLIDRGRAREVGQLPPKNVAGDCTALGRKLFHDILDHRGPGNTTTAPIVAWKDVQSDCTGGVQNFYPANQNLPWGNVYNGYVIFDTKVKRTGIDPMKVVTTNGGCQSTIESAQWVDDYNLIFKLRVRQQGYLRLTTHNDLAMSDSNGARLDGNLNPPNGENGIGLNEDDYIADNTCDPVFTRPTQLTAPNGTVSLRPASEGLSLGDVELLVAPGRQEAGFVELTNPSPTALNGVSLLTSALFSSSDEIPPSALTFTERGIDLPGESSRKVYFHAQLPSELASGLYTGQVVAVVEGESPVGQASIAIRVNRPPVLQVDGPQVLHAGDTATIRIRATDPEGDPIAFGARMPDGVEFSDDGNGNGLLSLEKTLTHRGEYPIEVSAYNPTRGVDRPPQSSVFVNVWVGSPRPSVISVSDAVLEQPKVEPGSIALAFSGDRSFERDVLRADLIDSAGTVHDVSVLSIAEDRMQYLVPEQTVPGTATLRIHRAAGGFASGEVEIDDFAPAIYSKGIGGPHAIEVAPGDGDSIILTISATGIRRHARPDAVKALAGGMEAQVLFAGADPQRPGLDQVRLRVPKELATRSDLPVILKIGGKSAGIVRTGSIASK